MSVSSADGDGVHLDDGRLVTELKVVELRKELEMRNLPKSGNKKELTERLKKYLMSNGEGAITSSSHGGTPRSSAHSSPVKSPEPMENPLVARYRATQEELLRQARQEAEMNRTSSGGEETEEKANDHPGSQSENTTSSKKSAKKDAPEEALVEPKEADIEEQKQPDQNDEPAISEPVSEKGDIAPEATPEKTEIEHTGEEFITQPDETVSNEKQSAMELEKGPVPVEEPKKSPTPTEMVDKEIKEEKHELEDRQLLSRSPSAADSSATTPAAASPKYEGSVTIKDENQETKDTGPAEREMPIIKTEPTKADEVVFQEAADQEDMGAPEGVVVGAQDELDYEEEEGDNEESKTGVTTTQRPPRTKRAPHVYTEGVTVVSEAAAASAADSAKTVLKEEITSEPAENFTAQGLVRRRPASPARNPVSKLIHIRQLKRPFTVKQLQTLLKNFGTIVEEDFWIDSIKSNCIAKFELEEQAEQAREGLHNVVWPTSSDQSLIVEFSTDEKLARRKGEGGKVDDLGLKIIVDNSKTNDEPSSRDNRIDSKESTEGHRRAVTDESQRSPSRKRKAVDDGPTRTLEDIFMKTKALPAIYYLPLTEEEVSLHTDEHNKQKEKKKNEASKPVASSRNGVNRDRSPQRRRSSPVQGNRRSPDPKRGRRDDSPPRGYRLRH
ncbi:RNSP1-SAP18 binding (RSB) motif domain-containing protein [Ditylenchus destructor]|uniref:RNSP1-SAP18 binding (RSB) motif domain-containing protein n=1 Tax=Ditylenchus destructor TaxID=166010 RepID=A0AAD4N259_9BILA|nr:RNSP1-SAP18 binding (RSB) motif domain-containing protein [Ditylenchus destructor]